MMNKKKIMNLLYKGSLILLTGEAYQGAFLFLCPQKGDTLFNILMLFLDKTPNLSSQIKHISRV
jgi:hypothetical protein